MKIKITKTEAYILGLMLVGFVIRALWIGAPELMGDENVYAMWSNNWQFLTAYAHALLHALFIHITYALLGVGDWYARFPSLIFGTLMIPLYYAFGKKLFNKDVGFIAAFLAAFDIGLIAFSRVAYIEATLLFFMLAACFAFYLSLEDKKYLLAVAVLTPLTIMVKANALYLLPIFGLFYLWEKGWGFYKEEEFMKYFFATAAIFLILMYPYLKHFVLFKQVMGFSTLGQAWDAAWVMERGPHIAHFIPNLLHGLKAYSLGVNLLTWLLSFFGVFLLIKRWDRPSRFLLLATIIFVVTAALTGSIHATNFSKELAQEVKNFVTYSPMRLNVRVVDGRNLAPAYMLFPFFAALAIGSIKKIKKEYWLLAICLTSIPYLYYIYEPMRLEHGSRTGMNELRAYAEGHKGVYISDDDICWPDKRWYLRNVPHAYFSDFAKLQQRPSEFYYIKSTQRVLNCSAVTDDEFESLIAQLAPVDTISVEGQKLYEIYMVRLKQE